MKLTIYAECNIYSASEIYCAVSRPPLQYAFQGKEIVSYFYKSPAFQTEIWINKVCLCSDNSALQQSRRTSEGNADTTGGH